VDYATQFVAYKRDRQIKQVTIAKMR